MTVSELGENGFTASYENLTADYKVTGILVNQYLTAEYTGEDIPVGQNYDKSDVIVKVVYHNGTTKTLPDDEWTESSLTVTDVGTNSFVASYDGMTTNYSVKGILIEEGLEAAYTGEDIPVGEEYDKSDVVIFLFSRSSFGF